MDDGDEYNEEGLLILLLIKFFYKGGERER